MRILFLSPRQAHPPNSGAKLRDYYFARALALQAELTYLYFTDNTASPADEQAFSFSRKVVRVPKPKSYTTQKVLTGMFGRWPLPVVNYTSGLMQAAIMGVTEKQRFDLVHLDAVQLAGYTPLLQDRLPGVPIVYNWHNIESELMARYAANERSLPKRIYAKATARRLARLEQDLLRTAYGHVVCSNRERRQLLGIVPGSRVEVVDNGVDTEFFRKTACTPTDQRHRLLFVGSMSYHANIEAATWFSRQIWPQIHEAIPTLRLTLAGANPAPAVRALAELPGVEVTGTVPDVRPYYAEAFAAIAPIRTAGGTRLKILEAMAARVPVISTELGAEGLDVAPGHNILLADNENAWVPALQSLQHSKTWDRVADAGLDAAKEKYDWQALGRRLCDTYRRWIQAR